MLEKAHAVRRVEKEVPEKMGGGDLEPAHDLREIELFPEGQLTSAKHFDGHQERPFKKTSPEAVMSTLATAVGNSPNQPKRIS